MSNRATTKRTTSQSDQPVTWSALGRSTKDTIESIVIAFILAFVFRAFIVEAYRIPTGSMAPTLYGAHRGLLCPDCGYRYAIEVQQRVPQRAKCPNCLFEIRDPLKRLRPGQPATDGGDRILVMKLGYELIDLFPSLRPSMGPRRWDVVVFKNPMDPSINFIKRLIGMPGETIEMIDGDIYANDRIVRKSGPAAEILWFLVYNADYLPTRKGRVDPRDVPGWLATDPASEKMWNTSGRVLIFKGTAGQAGTIRYNQPVVDFYAYDDPDFQYGRHFIVSDLRIECLLNLHKNSSSGQLELILTKRNDVFVARVDTTGKGQLFQTSRSDFQSNKKNYRLLGQGEFPPIEPNQPRKIRFENVDYQVRLTVGDRVVLETTNEQYHPQLEELRKIPQEEVPPIIQITGRDFNAQLWHLALSRDVYYRPVRIQTPPEVRSPLVGRLGHGVTGNPIHLGPNEYYVLGDNSPESMDSRLWYDVGPHLDQRHREGNYQLGTVPADQMVGRAFFVYWPAGFRLFENGPPIIPNVGEMRFIR